jgi:hypothetical protein
LPIWFISKGNLSTLIATILQRNLFSKHFSIFIFKRSAHQKLDSEVKRRIGELTLSDANLSDQKIADIIERENRLIISRSSVNSTRKEMHFFFKPKKLCQLISEEQSI